MVGIRNRLEEVNDDSRDLAAAIALLGVLDLCICRFLVRRALLIHHAHDWVPTAEVVGGSFIACSPLGAKLRL